MITLSTQQVEKIALDFFLGREPSILGEEADELRKQLQEDKKIAEEMEWSVELPFDIAL